MMLRTEPTWTRLALAVWLPLGLAAQVASAQEGGKDAQAAGEERAASDSLREVVEEQAAELAALRRRLEAARGEVALELDDLRLEVELLAEDIGGAGQAPPAPTAPGANAFNPQITVFADALGRIDDREVFGDEGDEPARIDDRFALREVEIDFRAAVDPYADAVVILAAEGEGGGELEAGVEEAYLTLKRLPFVDEAPAGLKLKAGRFRSSFGHLNRIHGHDLPWPTRPASLAAFLGEEGFAHHGLAGELFLPSAGEHDTLEATVEILGGGGIAIDEETEGSDFASVGRLNYYRELGDESDLTLGLSTYQGGDDADLYGADATWRWRPVEGRGRRSLLLGGELVHGDLATDDGPADSTGGYTYAQLQLGADLYAGLRYDWIDSEGEAGLDTQTFGAYVSYYTSEFLRLRVGAEHVTSDDDEIDSLDTVFVQLTFLFGSHPAEPYWVNR